MSSSKDKLLYLGLKAEIEGNFAIKEPIVTHSKGFQISGQRRSSVAGLTKIFD